MKVELKSLQDNPFRNFKVDPIDPDVVDALKTSIKDNPGGFWGGIVARRTKHNGIQLVFGHHRIKAAIKAGIQFDDIKVVDSISDADMIWMYANENATQRGNTGTALAGTVAAAIRFLLTGLFSGNLTGFPVRSKKAIETLLGQAGAERGIGYDIILDFLVGIPGINENTVRQQLANLKASGDYNAIVEVVKSEVEAEQKEQLKQLAALEEQQRKAAEAQRLAEQRAKEAEERRKEQAKAEREAKEEAGRKRAEADAKRAEYDKEKARLEAVAAAKRKAEAEDKMKDFDALRKRRNAMNEAAAVERDVTFDFEGVAKHLKQASHIDTFRNIVIGPGVKPYLGVKQQARLAGELVRLAKSRDAEMTSSFIKDNVGAMVHAIVVAAKKANREQQEEMLRADWSRQATEIQHEFARRAGDMLAAAMKLAAHDKKRPKGVTLHLTAEFKDSLKRAKEALKLIDSKIV